MKNANIALFVPNLGCPHCCSFCDQRKIAGQEKIPSPAEVERTAREALEYLGDDAQRTEIAFFGGSFTAIEPKLMLGLLDAAFPFTGKGGFRGIRLSTRPDAIDANVLCKLKKRGVTSIELGAQSMDARVLALNDRGHTPRDVESASALIAAYGFELGLQMMTGLYGSSAEIDRMTARAIAGLHPKTVRIYPTVVLEGTLLADLFRSDLYNPPGLEESAELCAELLEFFTSRDIRVIRLGLHAAPGIEDNYVAGPWHPAFRELCEGKIYLSRARKALEKLLEKKPDAQGNPEDVALFVAPREVSKLSGQHRCNILELEKEFSLRLKIRTKELEEFAVEAAFLNG